MVVKSILKAAFLCGYLLILQGCQSLHQSQRLINSPPKHVVSIKDIKTIPFYPQEEFYCGPTTLAEVFNYYGKNLTPENIAPNIFIPDREGSLQIEMVATTRKYNFVPYAGRSDLITLINLLSEGRPVIVLQNLAFSWMPMWHYAVVKGYDLVNSEFTLHTGVTENYKVDFELFERTWQRGDYWMLVPFPAGETSQYIEPFAYIKASYDLLTIGKSGVAIKSLKGATQKWPKEWLSFLLLGNFYLAESPQTAVSWYKQGFHSGKNQPNYLNNFAYALAQVGCHEEAIRIIISAKALAPDDNNIRDTADKIHKRINTSTLEECNFEF